MTDAIKVNDRVTFKANGTEEYGQVIRLQGSQATIKVWDSMVGEHYEVTQPVSRCSKD